MTDSNTTHAALHGVTLKQMIEHLVDRYGWDGLGERIDIRCFTQDPSVTSSLKFLRKTPWARTKVESLFVHSVTHPRKTPRLPIEADRQHAPPAIKPADTDESA